MYLFYSEFFTKNEVVDMYLQFDGISDDQKEEKKFENCENCRKYVQLYYGDYFEYVKFCCGVCIKFHSMKFIVPFNGCKQFEPK